MDSRARKLAQLVEQHYALLYRYAYRLTGSDADAEDLTQQTFVAAQLKWNQLRDESRAKSWLFAIARNAYLKQLRRPVCIPIDFADDFVAEPTLELALEPEVEFDSDQLQLALNELPEDFRSPLILFYFDEFSYREISDQLGVPIGTIMSRLSRAKAWLRRRLTQPDLAANSLSAERLS